MRTKDQILEQINKLPTGNVHQSQNLTMTTRVFIEVFIDIRDRLFTITKTLKDMDSYHVEDD